MVADWFFRPISLFPVDEEKEKEKNRPTESAPILRSRVIEGLKKTNKATADVFKKLHRILEDDDLLLDVEDFGEDYYEGYDGDEDEVDDDP